MSKEEAPTCSICADEFNKSDRKQVSCAFCHKNVCRGCLEQYVLTQGQQVLCPQTECRMPWTEEFLDGCFTAVFRNGTLRKHREKLLTDTEKARLPEFQERARRYKIAVAEDERLSSEFLEKIGDYKAEPIILELTRLRKVCSDMNAEYFKNINTLPANELQLIRKKERDAWNQYDRYRDANNIEINRLKKEKCLKAKQENTAPHVRDMVSGHGKPVRYMYPKYEEAGNKLYGENSGWLIPRDEHGAAPAREVIRISRGCPAEGCRGFLSTNFNCGVCDAKVCQHCHEIIGAKGDSIGQVGVGSVEVRSAGSAPLQPSAVRIHTCDPGAVETAKMLAKETRPCPTCKTLISKIDGCDQMWCTQCQTAFSWRTGQKEEGRVHNPHYYEWLRRTKGSVPREVGDVPGGPECCGQDTQLLQLPWLNSGYLSPAARAVLITPFMRDVASAYRETVKTFISEVHRKLEELQAYRRVRQINPETDAEHLERIAAINVEYLAGELDEDSWARRIYLAKRWIQLQSAMNELKIMYITAGRDIINSFVRGQGSIGAGVTCRQLGELMIYVKAELERITKRFNYTGFEFSSMISIRVVTGAEKMLNANLTDETSRRHFTPNELRQFIDIVAPVEEGAAVAPTAQKPAAKKKAAKPKPSAEPAASCATE